MSAIDITGAFFFGLLTLFFGFGTVELAKQGKFEPAGNCFWITVLMFPSAVFFIARLLGAHA